MADATRDQLLAAVKDLLTSGTYSDLVVTCGNDTYNLHKAIVCPRASFLAGAMRFAVGKEAEGGKIDLPEDDPAIVKLLIQFLYEGEYDPKLPEGELASSPPTSEITCEDRCKYTWEFPHTCTPGCPSPHHRICPHHDCGTNCKDNCVGFVCQICKPSLADSCPSGDARQLLIHSKVYQVADKYDIKGLKDLAGSKFAASCAKYWDEDQFVDAANHACAATLESDRGLRKAIIRTIADHMNLLNRIPIKEMLSEQHGIAMGVLELRAKDLGWLKE